MIIEIAPPVSGVPATQVPAGVVPSHVDWSVDTPSLQLEVAPAVITTRPPVLKLPLPTTTLTLPDAPFVAEPVRRVIIPLLPFEVVPVVSDNDPLTPLAPAFAVRILKVPLDVAVP